MTTQYKGAPKNAVTLTANFLEFAERCENCRDNRTGSNRLPYGRRPVQIQLLIDPVADLVDVKVRARDGGYLGEKSALHAIGVVVRCCGDRVQHVSVLKNGAFINRTGPFRNLDQELERPLANNECSRKAMGRRQHSLE